MGDSTINTTILEKLIADAKASGGSERGTYQTFINRLCEGLGLPPPDMHKEDRALNARLVRTSHARHRGKSRDQASHTMITRQSLLRYIEVR
jgi:hypothetical protein